MAVNGVPLDPKVLRERTEAQARQRQQNIIEDVFRVYEVTLVGRDIIDGHRVIVAAMKPRTGVPTRSLPGKYFPKVGGMAWVSEDDDQVVKVRFETLSDISVGWGFLGRVNTGSRLTLERRRVNEEVWLPARTTIDLTGRTLLVRSFSVQAATEFSDYKKLRVGTTEQYRPSPN